MKKNQELQSYELTPEIDAAVISLFKKEFELLNEYTAQDVLHKNVDVASKLLPNSSKELNKTVYQL